MNAEKTFFFVPDGINTQPPSYPIGVPDQTSPATTFAELALPLFDQLYNFAHWLTQDRTEAEDLVQETYTKALRGFAGFQIGTNFRAWMFRILRNAFLTSRTGVNISSSGEEELDEIASVDPTPEDLLIQGVERDIVRQALTELPVASREILLLCEVEEMKYEEIAQVLQIPIGTVMSRLHRARRALRNRVSEKFKGKAAWPVS
jgi:RNA polymerase sigma-70 factor (ECF subfamily)